MTWPQGWHRERGGDVVWAEGRQYTETGNNPDRVVVLKAYRHCGAFFTWSYLNALTPLADPNEAAAFVERATNFNEDCARRREAEAENFRRDSQRWQQRLPQNGRTE